MDKYIIGKNNSGKTRKMLEEARRTGAVVVCKHPLHMQNKANSYGIYGLKFISYEEMSTSIIEEGNIVIDELNEFFKCLFGVELDSFTMTIDWKEVNQVSFRVYDKKKKKFVTDNIFLTPDGELVESKRSVFGNKMTFVDQNRFVYQRAINLNDKNDIPIYVGDYLSANVSEDKEITGLVTYSEQLSSYIILSFTTDEYYTLGESVREFIEIIGNVFDDVKKR